MRSSKSKWCNSMPGKKIMHSIKLGYLLRSILPISSLIRRLSFRNLVARFVFWWSLLMGAILLYVFMLFRDLSKGKGRSVISLRRILYGKLLMIFSGGWRFFMIAISSIGISNPRTSFLSMDLPKLEILMFLKYSKESTPQLKLGRPTTPVHKFGITPNMTVGWMYGL